MYKYSILIVFSLFLATSTSAKWGTNCTANGGVIVKANDFGTDEHGNNLDKGGACHDSSVAGTTKNCNGQEFCKSKSAMNWWSSFLWCEAIGGKQADFWTMCPGTQTVDDQVCANLKSVLSTEVWSSMGGSGAANSIGVAKTTGKVATRWPRNGSGNTACAFCVENNTQ